MRIFEEFWYGNIEPTEYDTSFCKKYKKLLELICRNEEKLRAIMTDDQKALFEKYTDCVREYQTIADCLLLQKKEYIRRVDGKRYGKWEKLKLYLRVTAFFWT